MKLLLLAPQPFYQERGTPIAVDMILRVLSQRGDQVEVVTYHEGQETEYPNVTIHRTAGLSFIKGIPPGFSWKKLVCDGLMFFKAVMMAGRQQYQLVHAVEESVFIALVLKWMFRIPYIYDMDSSLRQQLVEKSILFLPVAFMLGFLEKLAVRNALAVLPVCDALAQDISKYEPKRVMVLQDVSLLRDAEVPGLADLRAELELTGPLLLYVGNLEAYQGIDLLLESFALLSTQGRTADLAIIGGKAADIARYQKKAVQLGIPSQRVHFLGPRPVEDLANYLAQADILVSPRVKGRNTPMKLYSYLHSGKAVLCTNLPTHTQLLNNSVAMLVDPTPQAFSRGMLELIDNDDLRLNLGVAGKSLIEGQHTFPLLSENVNKLYDWLSTGATEATIA